MVTLRERSSAGVNAVSVGVAADDVGAASANADILNQYASDGYSIYFPPGSYYIDREIVWSSKESIKCWGDAARIYQTTDNTDGSSRILRFDRCDKVEVSGLTFHTYYYLNRSSVTGSSRSSCVFTQLCTAVHIHDNLFEGFQCHCIRLNGDIDVRVNNNTFRDGHWDPLNNETTNTACILNWVGPANEFSERVIITDNSCNTRALHSILAQHSAGKLIIANNSCIATDENDNLITTYQADAPKAGIEIQYETSAAAGYTGSDNAQYDQMIVTGNNIQGCRFAGIEGQSSPRSTTVQPGIRGIIANNTIRYCGTDTNTGLGSNIQGGIVWIGYRDLIVDCNIITNIPNDGGNNGVSSIMIQGIWSRVDGSGNTSTPTSCIVSNNIISNCAARGIYVTSQTTGSADRNSGDIIINGNMVQDIDGAEYLRVVIPPGTFRAGHCQIVNNKFAGLTTVGTYVARVELGTTEPAECQICNNTFNFQDAIFTTQRPILDLVPDQFVLTGNRIKGDGVNAVGVDLRSLVTGERFERALIADNQIDNCKFGIGSSAGTTYGPFLLSNTTLTNCITPIENPLSVKHGHWENGRAIMYESVDPVVTAPQGNYLAGDMIWNTAASSTGDVMGWVSTGSGGWTPMIQIP